MSMLPCVDEISCLNLHPLKSGPPTLPLVQREFRTNEGDDDFATHPPITVDRIVMDVCPKAGNGNTGLPTGAPAVIDNVLQTIDFAYVGVISELYRNGLDYFSGIIANVKYYLGGVLIHTWDVAKEALSEIDLIAGTLLTFVNSSPSNWGLFDKTATGWIGQELVVNGGFEYDISNWTAFNSVISHHPNSIRVDDSANAGNDSRAYQDIAITNGIKCRFKFSQYPVSDGSSSYVGVIGSNFPRLSRGGNGDYSEDIEIVSGASIHLTVNGTSIVDFSKVSLKEVLKNA